MNVYDFDGTIYDGDCSVDFIFFLTGKYPKLLKYYPRIFIDLFKYLFNHDYILDFKSSFFKMICDVDLEKEVVLFWNKNIYKIKEWYLKQKRNTDLIISASPNFLVEEACERLGINCLSSVVDKKTGEYIVNFHDVEKVVQFRKKYPNKEILNFYSDSKNDIYLARIARKSYFVFKNKIFEWKKR